MSKLSPAEVRLLKLLAMTVGGTTPIKYLRPGSRLVAKHLLRRGLIRKRDFWNGWVKATERGKRSLSDHQ